MWRSPDKAQSVLWRPSTRRAAASGTTRGPCCCWLPSRLSCKISVPVLSMPPSSSLSPQPQSFCLHPTYSLTLKLCLWTRGFFFPSTVKIAAAWPQEGTSLKEVQRHCSAQCLLKTSVTHPAASPDAPHRRTHPLDISLWGVTAISFSLLPASREARSLPDSVRTWLNYIFCPRGFFCLELKMTIVTQLEAGPLVIWLKAPSLCTGCTLPPCKRQAASKSQSVQMLKAYVTAYNPLRHPKSWELRLHEGVRVSGSGFTLQQISKQVLISTGLGSD